MLWKIYEIIHSGIDSENVLSVRANTAMCYHAADVGLVIVSIVTSKMWWRVDLFEMQCFFIRMIEVEGFG